MVCYPLLLVAIFKHLFDGQDGETPNGQAVNSMGPSVVEIPFFFRWTLFRCFFSARKIDIHTIKLSFLCFLCMKFGLVIWIMNDPCKMKNWKRLLYNVPRNKNQTDSDLAPAHLARVWLRPKVNKLEVLLMLQKSCVKTSWSVGSLSHILYLPRAFWHQPNGGWPWDFWSINSMKYFATACAAWLVHTCCWACWPTHWPKNT